MGSKTLKARASIRVWRDAWAQIISLVALVNHIARSPDGATRNPGLHVMHTLPPGLLLNWRAYQTAPFHSRPNGNADGPNRKCSTLRWLTPLAFDDAWSNSGLNTIAPPRSTRHSTSDWCCRISAASMVLIFPRKCEPGITRKGPSFVVQGSRCTRTATSCCKRLTGALTNRMPSFSDQPCSSA